MDRICNLRGGGEVRRGEVRWGGVAWQGCFTGGATSSHAVGE